MQCITSVERVFNCSGHIENEGKTMCIFKKKNKTAKEKEIVSRIVSSETEVRKEKTISNSGKRVMCNFKPIYSNYESIEKVINIIEETGITLESISTHGTNSSHDGDVGFDYSYNNMTEFISKVFEDYKWAKERHGVSLNWGCTIFSFYKSISDKGVQISITSVGPEAEKIYFFCWYTDKDKIKAENVLLKLDEYLEKC